MKYTIFILIAFLNPWFFLRAETYKIAGAREFVFIARIKPGSYFDSKTTGFEGAVTWKGAAISGKITVKLETLSSGISLRDSHMREKNIHTAQYPEAIFQPEKIEGDAKLIVGHMKQFRVIGKMSFHGVTREVASDVRATLQADGSITINSRLKLLLSDFGVEAPRLAFVVVEDEVTVLATFVLQR